MYNFRPHLSALLAPLRPKLFSVLPISREQLKQDIGAGIIVGVLAIPLAIAFAIASGVPPEKGLYTAVVAGFLISFFGGSRAQIGGPTGAFVVIIYDIVQHYGIGGLMVATFLAGIILVAMGVLQLGSLIKFIPHPLIVGFTSGIALIIFTSQINDALGLHIRNMPSDFVAKWYMYAKHLHTVNLYSLGITVSTVLIATLWQRYIKRIPGSIVAILLATITVKMFGLEASGVETIGSRFGALPTGIPLPDFSTIDPSAFTHLISPAFSIALLGAIEALLSAVVADGMIGSRHRSNMELVAQGIANIVSPIFGGIPATGAIARTAANIRNGGRTPVAGIVHSLTVLLILMIAGSWAALIPLPCLAGILIVVSYSMSEWRSFRSGLRAPKSDIWVMVITFLLTVFVDLTSAIQMGMLIAVFMFMHRMAQLTNIGIITRELNDDPESGDSFALDSMIIPDGVQVFEINGPFFFGAIDKFKEAMRIVAKKPRVRIIRMRRVPTIDASGLHALEEVWRDSKNRSIHFMIADIHTQPLLALEKSDIIELIGRDNVFADIDEALYIASGLVDEPTVATTLPKPSV